MKNSLPTCQEFDGKAWETYFLDSITLDRNGDDEVNSGDDDDDDDDDDGVDVAPPLPKLWRVCEAIDLLEDVKRLLEYHGCMEECIHALTI